MKATATTYVHNLEDSRRSGSFLFYLFVATAFVVFSLLTQPAFGQSTKSGKEKPPEFEEVLERVELKTKDNLTLKAYYAPSSKGKDAIPVLIVHDWRGQGSPYDTLVKSLWEAGCAVLIPDYRGHGGSKEYINRRGEKREFNVSTMSARDVNNILSYDLEEAKRFLKEENNDEELNLNALVVIGIREGCVMGALWTMRDWAFPSAGEKKQGQDVKAFVMISPTLQFKGLRIDDAFRERSANILGLPIMITAGASSPEADDANRLAKRIGGFKKRIGQGSAEGFATEMVNTRLSGALFVREATTVVPAITEFVTSQVHITESENPWIQRK